ncbi:hypothetical protein PSM36_0730 [Proteiniphilum saccharofermentans]|uniref:Uncharacterized protein n=1 Tax=Proteiniphilum saccharofermentans TaxID=1642647 RepID=A0A1R3T4Q9_9BACT|nr:hypothetical protein PSM36_0730 [Proteiniphilum saccharofermentans]
MVLPYFIPCPIFASLNKTKSKKIMKTTDIYFASLPYTNNLHKASLPLSRMCC